MRRERNPQNVLWKHFKKTKCRQARKQLIERYLPLVEGLARSVSSRLPNTVDPEDLTSAGMCGLLKAIDAYDPSRGTRFETYCHMRVKGSMLDELRNQDWIPREARHREALFSKAFSTLRERLGRETTDSELAEALDMSVLELRDMIIRLTFSNIISINATDLDTYFSTAQDRGDGLPLFEEEPSEAVHRREMTELIDSDLTQLEKMIIMLYYQEGMTMKEIGGVVDISESRVCQVHSRLINRLRARYSSEY